MAYTLWTDQRMMGFRIELRMLGELLTIARVDNWAPGYNTLTLEKLGLIFWRLLYARCNMACVSE